MGCLMNRVPAEHSASRQPNIRRANHETHLEITMSRKQQKMQVARKLPKAIADGKKVRFGNGMAPLRVARAADESIRDTGAVRFGNGMVSPSLLK